MAIDGLTPITGAESVRNLLTTTAVEPASTVTPSPGDVSAFVPTSDLSDLLRGTQESAQVRQEIIGEVARRLAAGELFTRPAAEQTVQALLETHLLLDGDVPFSKARITAIDGLTPITGAESVRNLLTTTAVEPASTVTPSPGDVSAFVPTSDLSDLLPGTQESAQVRQEIIGEVARRLAAGELFTRPAAEQKVQSLLESQPVSG